MSQTSPTNHASHTGHTSPMSQVSQVSQTSHSGQPTPAWPSDGVVRLSAVDDLPPQPAPARVKVLHVIT
jgi:hypothetical protein